MNWTCVVYGVPMFLVTVWYFVSAKNWFKGPKVNIEHMMLGREEAVVEGQEKRTSLSEVQSAEKELKS
jgi:hypothetical protein